MHAPGKKLRPPSLAEEAKLLRYYESKIRDICRGFGFPNKVSAAAIVFLKRFYVTHSTLEHDPKDVVLTMIYLAGKVSLHLQGLAHLLSAHAEVLRLPGVQPSRLLTLLDNGISFEVSDHGGQGALSCRSRRPT